jgi:hypothetical protein
MKKTLLIPILFLSSNLFGQPTLKEFQLLLPNSDLDEHTIQITFPNAHKFVLCEFDRLVEGSVQIFFNDEPTPQIINSGQGQQFVLNPKVQPVKKIKLLFTTNSDTWVRFQI